MPIVRSSCRMRPPYCIVLHTDAIGFRAGIAGQQCRLQAALTVSRLVLEHLWSHNTRGGKSSVCSEDCKVHYLMLLSQLNRSQRL